MAWDKDVYSGTAMGKDGDSDQEILFKINTNGEVLIADLKDEPTVKSFHENHDHYGDNGRGGRIEDPGPLSGSRGNCSGPGH